jgi:hypothetical protein
LQRILDLKNHKTTISKFKTELQRTKNQLVPMYLKEHQQKKLSTANMVTSLSSTTKSQNMRSIKLLYIKLSSKQQIFCTQIFIPLEKDHRYVLYMLDKYKNKVHIIDPREATPEEFEKEKVDIDHLDPFEADRILRENEQAEEERKIQFQEYHVHKSAIVSIYT